MADLPSDFWGGWIAVITVVSLLGLLWLVLSIYFSKDKQKESTLPIWDSTLREGHHPAPMWWFWMILISLIISVIYLILYPGLGAFKGALAWSQSGRLDQSHSSYYKKFSTRREEILQMSISTLQNEPQIMKSAQRIFAQHCAACHGSKGEGQSFAFPNLMDDVWQWGGSEAQLEHTLKKGRNAVMIGWQNVIGDQGVKQVADYVKSLSHPDTKHNNSEGEAIYAKNCIACHGTLGEGNPTLGAPKLNDDIWLYGNTDEALYHTIAKGRNGIMPAFDQRLDDTQIRMLIAWLLQ